MKTLDQSVEILQLPAIPLINVTKKLDVKVTCHSRTLQNFGEDLELCGGTIPLK